jgi:hypothetical protein
MVTADRDCLARSEEHRAGGLQFYSFRKQAFADIMISASVPELPVILAE